MKLTKTIATAFIIVSGLGASAQTSKAKMDAYVNNLMSKMTLDEKIGQLNLPSIGFDITGPILSQGVEEKIQKGLVGGVFNTYTPNAVRKLQELAVTKSRLKIPLLFGYDVIHGHRTIFPVPLGLSASWDLNLIQRTAAAAADEATADGLNWVFSPMVDIARDPRWGRVSEGAGEDTWLGSQIAKAMVRGYQGDMLGKNTNTVLACVKHFALYGAAEAGRDYNVVDMSERKMFEYYLPPYKAALDAGAGSVMSSFNEINGVPAAANKWLLTDLLRTKWGFNGMVATDYTAIMELMNHGVGDAAEVSRLALVAGNDMDMVSELYLNELKKLVQAKKLDVKYIDIACRRVLETKYKLGLFTDPYRYISEDRARTQIMNTEKLALAKEAAEKSMVLLKNKNVLPLSSSAKVAFVGPMVKNQRDLIGNWSGAGDYKKAISVWEALQAQYPGNKFTYAKGCNVLENADIINKLNPHGAEIVLEAKSAKELIDDAVNAAKDADVVVAMLGEPFGMTGEAASRSDINLPENQKDLLKALKATGKPVVLVLMNGRPLTLQWEDDNLDAILETWYAGTRAGDAIADVLFGKYNPSAKLSMTFPRSVGQVPIYYNAKNTGRPMDPNQKYTSKYLDVPNSPLYPFGYGLSYTTFSYSPVQLNRNQIKGAEKVTASITVTNTGKYAGEETVQLYIRDMVGSVTRPLKELKSFQKVYLKPGESKTVNFTIGETDLRFYDINMKYTSEAGDFKVFIGSNSRDTNEAAFKLVK